MNDLGSRGRLPAREGHGTVWTMEQTADLRQRVQTLTQRAAREQVDGALLAEMEDLLARGYACALRGDSMTRRMQRRVDALSARLDEPDAAAELTAVVREQSKVREATRELRSDLSVMHRHWDRLGDRRLRLA